MPRLFSYGTLRLPAVQEAVFGGPVPTVDDAVVGQRLVAVPITDPTVLATSGAAVHPGMVPGAADDVVEGAVLELTDAQLAAADAYEVADYHRVLLPLRSGGLAWGYPLARVPGFALDLLGVPTLTGTPRPLAAAPADPMTLFVRWFEEAVADGVPEPRALTLATVDAQGLPDARVLVLKDLTPDGALAVAGSADSAKGRQLADRPVAAATFWWPPPMRSVRLRGDVEVAPPEVAAADLAARTASARSLVGAADWRVWWLRPRTVEFWQGSADRRHHRLRYSRSDVGWTHRGWDAPI